MKDFNKDLKDRADEIDFEVPENLKKRIKETIDNLPDKKKKRSYSGVKIAGFAVLGLLTFNLLLPTYAEALPIIGPTFKSINEAIGHGEKYVEKAKEVSITQGYDNIKMTINNIYFDGTELAIAYEVKSLDGFKEEPKISPIIKTKDEYLEYKNEIQEGEFRDETTYVGIASYIFTGENPPDKKEISFVVNNIYYEWVGEYPEKMKFNIKLDSNNMGKKTYKIDKKFTYEDTNVTIKQMIVTPFNIILHYDYDLPLFKDGYYDDGTVRKTQKYNLSFRMVDQDGVVIASNGSSASGSEKDDRIFLTGNSRFIRFDKNIENVTMVPVLSGWDFKEKQEKINLEGKTTAQNIGGEVFTVNNIDFQEDKTVINMDIKTYLGREGYYDVGFTDKSINSEGYLNVIEVLDKKLNDFDKEKGYNVTFTLPKLDKNKAYYMNINVGNENILEGEKFGVDLR